MNEIPKPFDGHLSFNVPAVARGILDFDQNRVQIYLGGDVAGAQEINMGRVTLYENDGEVVAITINQEN